MRQSAGADAHPLRRDGRAVEDTGLENRRRVKPSVGSNPTLSAIPTSAAPMPGPLVTVWDTGRGIFDKRAGKSGNDVAGAGWLSLAWAVSVQNQQATNPARQAFPLTSQSSAHRGPSVFVQL